MDCLMSLLLLSYYSDYMGHSTSWWLLSDPRPLINYMDCCSFRWQFREAIHRQKEDIDRKAQTRRRKKETEAHISPPSLPHLLPSSVANSFSFLSSVQCTKVKLCCTELSWIPGTHRSSALPCCISQSSCAALTELTWISLHSPSALLNTAVTSMLDTAATELLDTAATALLDTANSVSLI